MKCLLISFNSSIYLQKKTQQHKCKQMTLTEPDLFNMIDYRQYSKWCDTAPRPFNKWADWPGTFIKHTQMNLFGRCRHCRILISWFLGLFSHIRINISCIRPRRCSTAFRHNLGLGFYQRANKRDPSRYEVCRSSNWMSL